MTTLIVIFVGGVIVWLAIRNNSGTTSIAPYEQPETKQKTTGNDTYDFINEATGTELFDYKKDPDD